MNDPHVESLYYRLVPKLGVQFENAPPLEHNTAAFSVSLTNGDAIFKLNVHCSSKAEAFQLIQPFVESWEIASGLEIGPDSFKLEFDCAYIIDRSPPHNVIEVIGVAAGKSTVRGTGEAVHSQYPKPPTEFEVSPLVTAMYYQYKGLQEGKLAIGHVAYFCSTIIRDNGGPNYFCIGNTVLTQMKRLSTEKGGLKARKAVGMNIELSACEHLWLEEAIKMTIRRAAERAAEPTATLAKITMADLPPLG